MGMPLAFYVVFACVRFAMPLLMAIAEWFHLKTGDKVYYTLAPRWAVATAIMFAVGAVSGTVLPSNSDQGKVSLRDSEKITACNFCREGTKRKTLCLR